MKDYYEHTRNVFRITERLTEQFATGTATTTSAPPRGTPYALTIAPNESRNVSALPSVDSAFIRWRLNSIAICPMRF